MGVGITSAFLHLGELVRRSLPVRRVWLRSAATVGLLAAIGLAAAADAVPALPADARAKLTTALRFAIDDAATATNGIGRAMRSVVRSTGNDQTVVVLLDVPVTDATLADIRATGATIRSSAARWNSVTVEATAAQVAALATLPAVAQVKLPGKPIHRAQPGTVNNPAGTVIKSDLLTFTTNVTGAGQKIGIISDSINLTAATGPGSSTGSASPFTLTGTRPQQSGDLPASIQVIDYGANDGGEDEGEAMMEEAYKLAPGAAFAFATCGVNQLEFAANLTKLAQAHCTVICDDVGFGTEPFFQDGPIAQAAQAFIAGGGIYLSAFGNDFDQGMLQTYNDVSGATDPRNVPLIINGTVINGAPTNGNDFHNWGIPGSATPGFLPLQVPADGEITIVLQWNQPFHSNAMGDGASSDYNLFLYNGPSIASGIAMRDPSHAYISTDTQNAPTTPGDPLEGFVYDAPHNHGNPTTVYLAIDKLHSSVNNVFRMVILGEFTVPPSTDRTAYNSVFGAAAGFGHPTSKNVLGIAAADVTVSPPVPESFTSKGGVGTAGIPYFFDATGAALSPSPTTYDKPELTAPDGIQTFTGFDSGTFFGTSAAVPNAAAAAALAWSANRALTNAQIRARLVATADDITTPPASNGNDALTGLGMVNAQRAAGAPVTTIAAPGANGSHGTGTIAIQVTFAAPMAVTGTPRLLLNTAPPRFATYTSGTGTNVLTFTYTIVAGDVSAHLDLASNTALDLNGGTIVVATATTDFHVGDPVMLQLPTPGAAGSLSANSSVVVSAIGPSVTIVPDQARKNTSGFAFTVTFSDAVTGLAAGQFAITNGTAGALTGSGTTYTLNVTATATGTVTVTLPAGVVLDSNSLGNHAGSGTATFDQTPPTLVITPALNTVVTTNTDPVTFTFSEAVTGFTASDVGITNGTTGTLTGNGAVYHMTVTAGTPGPLTITVLGGAVADLANNPSTADATATVTVSTVPASSGHGCGLGSMFASVFGLGLLAIMARLRGRDGAARR